MNEEEAFKKFQEFAGKIAEQFPDFVLICRPPDGGTMWRSSDGTWALGATQRYIDHVREGDRLEVEEHFYGKDH